MIMRWETISEMLKIPIAFKQATSLQLTSVEKVNGLWPLTPYGAVIHDNWLIYMMIRRDIEAVCEIQIMYWNNHNNAINGQRDMGDNSSILTFLLNVEVIKLWYYIFNIVFNFIFLDQIYLASILKDTLILH